MIQSNFSYMISPEFFDMFVKEEVESTAAHMVNAFYHLDGIGQLAHLDSLLSLPYVQGIQWVPGEGAPYAMDWSEVYSKISRAGKKLQLYYNLECYMDEVLKSVQRPDDLVKMQFGYGIGEKEAVLKKLRGYGVE